MAAVSSVPFQTTHQVRDTCVCLHLQRAARVIGRRFDEAFRRIGLTNGQFSLLMALNQPAPPAMGAVARLLGMDRTTLTAALKPLRQGGLVEVASNATDLRTRHLTLTEAGRAALAEAVPIWRDTHGAIEQELRSSPDALRAALRMLGTR